MLKDCLQSIYSPSFIALLCGNDKPAGSQLVVDDEFGKHLPNPHRKKTDYRGRA